MGCPVPPRFVSPTRAPWSTSSQHDHGRIRSIREIHFSWSGVSDAMAEGDFSPSLISHKYAEPTRADQKIRHAESQTGQAANRDAIDRPQSRHDLAVVASQSARLVWSVQTLVAISRTVELARPLQCLVALGLRAASQR